MAALNLCARAARIAVSRSTMSAISGRTCCATPRQLFGGQRAFTISAAAQVKKYTQDHEWIEMDSDGTTGIIGISTYAASALGDVVFVELPTQDTQVSAGDTIGAVESVKSASDILTPVAGTILEGNAVLEEKPATINKAPEGEGWIAKIKVDNVEDLEGLMDAEAYKEYTEE